MFGQQKIGHIPVNAVSNVSFGAGYGYLIGQSVLFNDGDSPYLTKTFSSAGDRRTWTYSGWVKNTAVDGTANYLLSSSEAPYAGIVFQDDDLLTVSFDISSYDVNTGSAVIREKSGWLNVVVAVDTTQTVQEERIRVWINGIQFKLAVRSGTWPIQNAQGPINNNAIHDIGALTNSGHRLFFDGFMADVNFIDGQALGPEYFGTFNSDGIWIPINPTTVISEYGQNGFRLTFSDSSNFGTDSAPITAGHSTLNAFTPSGFSSSDQRLDVPTIDDTNKIGNAAVLNNQDLAGDTANITLSEGNTNFVKASTGYGHVRSTLALPPEGKLAFKYTYSGVAGSTLPVVGLAADDGAWKSMSSATVFPAQVTSTFVISAAGEAKKDNAAGTTYTAAATGYVGYCAVDMTNGNVWFGLDSGGGISWFGGGNPATNTTPTLSGLDNTLTWFIAATSYSGVGLTFDFSNEDSDFPTGFSPINTSGLTADIAKPSKYFKTLRFVGNAAQRKIQNLEFRPDLVWIKNRDQADSHKLLDSVRGPLNVLFPDDTAAEATDATGLLSFNSDGFTLGTGAGGFNDVGEAFVAWCWDAGSDSPTQNNAGTLESLVKSDTTSGFSIVGYTGDGNAGATIGHGLGAVPEFFMVKNRTTAARSWLVYHKDSNVAPETGAMILDGTLAFTVDTTYWNDTEPTATVFSVGTNGQSNTVSDEYIGYFWRSVNGFSKFASYTGNGSSLGPAVHTGFRPAWIMVKRSDIASSWTIVDEERMPINGTSILLSADTAAAETTGVSDLIEFTSSGFRPIGSGNAFNTNTGNYVYAAFASQPIKYANGR